jgi:hypothetical protein
MLSQLSTFVTGPGFGVAQLGEDYVESDAQKQFCPFIFVIINYL